MSRTPVGDWIARRYPPNDGSTHWMGNGDDPGCCGGPHPACTYAVARREALLSLAAELDARAGGSTAPFAFRIAARMARERAGVDPDAAEHAPMGHGKAEHVNGVPGAAQRAADGAP